MLDIFLSRVLRAWGLLDIFSRFVQILKNIVLPFRFLRGVAYRQFTRMVHGRLRDKRIPLPSCAYTAIRSTHKPTDDVFTGYDELETDEESQ